MLWPYTCTQHSGATYLLVRVYIPARAFNKQMLYTHIIYSQVYKQAVDSFTQYNVPVPFNVRVQWIRDRNNPPKPLSREIKLDGAEKKFDFLTVTSPALCLGMCCSYKYYCSVMLTDD